MRCDGLLTAILALWLAAGVSSAWAEPAPARFAKSWQELTPQEREQVFRNYERFQELPPAKKDELRERYRRWKDLPREDQERLRKRYQSYQALPESERRRLRDRMRGLPGR